MNEDLNKDSSPVKISEIFTSISGYSILRIILFAISYVFFIFITRLLGPSEFGKLVLDIQVATEIGTILVLGFPFALTKFVAGFSSKKEKGIIFSQSVYLSTGIFIIFGIIFFLVINLLKTHIPAEIYDVRIMLFIFIVAMGFTKLGIGMLSGLGRFISGTIYDGLIQITWRLLAFMVLMIFPIRKFNISFNISVVIQFLFFIIIFIILRNYFSVTHLKIESMILKFSTIVMLSQIIFAVIALIDSLLLRIILRNSAEVGYFYTGTRLPILFQTLFFIPLTIPFLYYFSRPESTFEMKSTIIKFGTRMLTVVFSAVSLFVFTFSDKFIIFFFGKAYNGSIFVLQVYIFTFFFIALETFMQPYFFSINRPLIPAILGLIYLVIAVVMDIILIPYFKAGGPAIAAVCALFIRTTVYLILMKKQKIDIIKTFLILFVILAASICFEVFVLIHSGIFIFIILVFITRLITIADIKRMISMLNIKKKLKINNG